MGRHRSLGVLGGLDPVCGHSTLKHERTDVMSPVHTGNTKNVGSQTF